MRALLYVLLALGVLPLFSFGLVFAIDGRQEPRDAAREFLVGFDPPGTECKERYGLRLDPMSGQPLSCLPSGFRWSGTGGQYGLDRFSRAQYDEVIALADRLADDGGLESQDREEIQRRVDTIAATLPPAGHPWLWGPRMAWIGWAMLVASVADLLYLIQAFRRRAAASRPAQNA